jgi:hypothetical protein
MLGLSLLATQETAALYALRQTASSVGSGTATAASPARQVYAATDTLSTLLSLNPNTLDSIVQQVAGFDALQPPGAATSDLSGILNGVAAILAKGQGAYVVTYVTPGGSLQGAVTPAEFADWQNGVGPSPIGYFPISEALSRLAAQQTQAPSGGSQAVTLDAIQNTGASVALAVLHGPAPAKPISLPKPVQQKTPGLTEVAQGVFIGVVFIPPSDAVTTQTATLSVSTTSGATLNGFA